ncbi:hypothetical protein CLAIMM_10785 isoform 1, partial [Cladophialophora immunda]
MGFPCTVFHFLSHTQPPISNRSVIAPTGFRKKGQYCNDDIDNHASLLQQSFNLMISPIAASQHRNLSIVNIPQADRGPRENVAHALVSCLVHHPALPHLIRSLLLGLPLPKTGGHWKKKKKHLLVERLREPPVLMFLFEQPPFCPCPSLLDKSTS